MQWCGSMLPHHRIHTYTHTYIHTYIHNTYTVHTYIHTYIHIHTYIQTQYIHNTYIHTYVHVPWLTFNIQSSCFLTLIYFFKFQHSSLQPISVTDFGRSINLAERSVSSCLKKEISDFQMLVWHEVMKPESPSSWVRPRRTISLFWVVERRIRQNIPYKFVFDYPEIGGSSLYPNFDIKFQINIALISRTL